jgi:ribosome-associated toxin RatA of RatAB toxin-antitoxin module
MPSVERSVLLPYSAEQMFDLVDRVEDYPQFLPWCDDAKVAYRDTHGLRATVHIGFKGVRQSFTTQNVNDRPHSIDMQLVEGPFSELSGQWQFLPLANVGCKVVFKLRYEFANRVLGQLIGPVFSQIAGSFVDSFTERAEAVYGK